MPDTGIWVRLVIEGETILNGFVPGAESPNDFWVTFKSQLIRMERVTEEKQGKKTAHDRLYVNRDYILTAAITDPGR